MGLEYTDIDYETKTIHVQRQLGKNHNIEKANVNTKTYTKQEIDLKTPSSRRKMKIPEIVFDVMMEERNRYERIDSGFSAFC